MVSRREFLEVMVSASAAAALPPVKAPIASDPVPAPVSLPVQANRWLVLKMKDGRTYKHEMRTLEEICGRFWFTLPTFTEAAGLVTRWFVVDERNRPIVQFRPIVGYHVFSGDTVRIELDIETALPAGK